MTIKNEEYWSELESLPPFAQFGCASAWSWLEKLQNGGRLRQIDIIQLQGLLDEVYKLGVEAGKEEK